MPSVYDLKPKFQDLLRPLVVRMARQGITANHVTVAAMLISFGVGGLIFNYPQQSHLLLLLPITLFVRMALNAIDGMLAREHNMKSALGAFLNELGDVFSDAALYLPLALVAGFSPTLIVVIVLLSVISEMTGVIAVQIGKPRRYDGPMGKSDRAFIFGTITLLLALGVGPGDWIFYLEVFIVLLLLVTIVKRMRNALVDTSS